MIILVSYSDNGGFSFQCNFKNSFCDRGAQDISRDRQVLYHWVTHPSTNHSFFSPSLRLLRTGPFSRGRVFPRSRLVHLPQTPWYMASCCSIRRGPPPTPDAPVTQPSMAHHRVLTYNHPAPWPFQALHSPGLGRSLSPPALLSCSKGRHSWGVFLAPAHPG
jgi:hypothetical protein